MYFSTKSKFLKGFLASVTSNFLSIKTKYLLRELKSKFSSPKILIKITLSSFLLPLTITTLPLPFLIKVTTSNFTIIGSSPKFLTLCKLLILYNVPIKIIIHP